MLNHEVESAGLTISLLLGTAMLLSGCKVFEQPRVSAATIETPTPTPGDLKLDLGVATKLRDAYDVVLAHGWMGNSRIGITSQINASLTEAGVAVDAPDLPGGDNPEERVWTGIFRQKLSEGRKKLAVGRSAGADALLYAMEGMDGESGVDTMISVATALKDPTLPKSWFRVVKGFLGLDNTNYPRGFYDKLSLFPKVLNNSTLKTLVFIQSSDDRFNAPMDEVSSLAQKYGVEVTDCPDGNCDLPPQRVIVLNAGEYGHFDKEESANVVLRVINRLRDRLGLTPKIAA